VKVEEINKFLKMPRRPYFSSVNLLIQLLYIAKCFFLLTILTKINSYFREICEKETFKFKFFLCLDSLVSIFTLIK